MARKYKSSRKYNYNSDSKTKKLILIILAAVLVLAAAVFLIYSLLSGDTESPNGNARIDVMSPPDKTTYYVGESPNWSGLQIRYFVSTDEVYYFGPDNCTITGFDSSAPVNDQVITVKYRELTATFKIDIIDPNNPEQPADPTDPDNSEPQKPDSPIDSVSFKTMPRTQYTVGQWLSVKNGVLLIKYKNGETREMELTHDMVHNFTTEKPGTYTITVVFVDNGYRAELAYEITVTN